MIPDGYSDLLPGKIASVVTYLEMIERPALANVFSSAVRLRRIETPRVEWYRPRYLQAGAQWLWFSRLEMTPEQLAARLCHSTTEIFTVETDANEIGLAELDRSKSPDVEIATFALFSEAMGKGLGSSFMAKLLEQAWDARTKRVWLHTCTLDGPAALGFYIKQGFRPYRRAIEIADDPRIRGLLPEDAAPQVPIIR
jgi:GNAT superfamily N-acetyltransferase